MATVGELYRDIGEAIDDVGNVVHPAWKLLRWINKAIKDIVWRTDCLWTSNEIEGQRRIAILDYADLEAAGNILTVTIDDVDTDLTEGVDWDAATSNAVTATDLASAITALTNISAYADGAYVYVCGVNGSTTSIACDAATTDLTIADAGYETFELANILTRFRIVKTIYNLTDGILYRSLTQNQYDRFVMDSAFTSSVYTINANNLMSIKKGGGNLSSSNTVTIEHLQYPAELTLSSESPPGILSRFDDVIINRCLKRVNEHKRVDNPSQVGNYLYGLDIEYERMIKQIKHELRSQGDPGINTLLYQWK